MIRFDHSIDSDQPSQSPTKPYPINQGNNPHPDQIRPPGVDLFSGTVHDPFDRLTI